MEVSRHFVFLSCCHHAELALNRICRQEQGQVLVSHPERCSWLRTVSQHIRVLCCSLQGLLVAASAGYLPPGFVELLQQNGWTCRVTLHSCCCTQEVLEHRRQPEAMIRVCGIALGRGWIIFHLRWVGRNMRHTTRALQLRCAVVYWSNFKGFFHALEMSSFHYPYLLWCQMCLWPTPQNSWFFFKSTLQFKNCYSWAGAEGRCLSWLKFRSKEFLQPGSSEWEELGMHVKNFQKNIAKPVTVCWK